METKETRNQILNINIAESPQAEMTSFILQGGSHPHGNLYFDFYFSYGLESGRFLVLAVPVALTDPPLLAVAVGLAEVPWAAFALLGGKPGRQRLMPHWRPSTIGVQAHLPQTVVKAIKSAIVIVIVRPSDDYVDPHSGIENELHALDVFATMANGSSVGRRPVPVSRNRPSVDHLF